VEERWPSAASAVRHALQRAAWARTGAPQLRVYTLSKDKGIASHGAPGPRRPHGPADPRSRARDAEAGGYRSSRHKQKFSDPFDMISPVVYSGSHENRAAGSSCQVPSSRRAKAVPRLPDWCSTPPRPRGRACRGGPGPKPKATGRQILAWLREAPCLDCGRKFPPVCMDFDHRDPATKDPHGFRRVGCRALGRGAEMRPGVC